MVVLRFTYVGIRLDIPQGRVRASDENYLIEDINGVCVALMSWGEDT
jgi:hypothetical protein